MKTIFTLLLSISCFCAQAQKWALPSSTWTYVSYGFSGQSYITIKDVRDTAVNGITCRAIGKANPVFSYQSNDTVFFFLGGKFRPTYYYKAKVGDTLSFYNTGYQCTAADSIIRSVVSSIDSLVLPNQTLKRFHNAVIPDSTGKTIYDFQFTYTEKLGSNYLYPFFNSNCIADGDNYGLCSYSDSTLPRYYLNVNDSCMSTAIFNLKQEAIRLFPNPATDMLYIETNHSWRETALTIRNTMGQEVYIHSAYDFSEPVNLRTFLPGFYFLEITDSKQKFTSRFIRQ